MNESAKAYAAVDLGASSGRVMLGRYGPDGLHVTEVHRFANGPADGTGVLLWNTDLLFAETIDGLRAAVAMAAGSGSDLAGIGIDSWGVDYGLLDRSGAFGGRVKHHRGADPAGPDAAREFVDAERAYALTGVHEQPINTSYQLRSDVADGVVNGCETPLFVPDLWVHLLTGEVGAERTIASTSQLLDLAAGDWSAELVQAWGLRQINLPPVVSAGTQAGATTQYITDLIGARRPVPVYRVAEHDTASALAFAAPDSGELLISSGSWSLVGTCLSAPVTTEAARTNGYTNELGVDDTVLFLRNLAGMWLLVECARVWSADDGHLIDPKHLVEEMQAAGEGSGPVPTFDVGHPDLLAPGDMPAKIAALCRENGGAPDGRLGMVRSIVESLAMAYAETAVSCAALTEVPIRSVRIVGGGSRNELLCRRTADLTGLPVIAGPAEASALGNLAVQMVSAGEVASLAEAYAAAHRLDPQARFYQPAEIRRQ